MGDVEWRAAVGWEGFYEVCSDGSIRSLDRAVSTRGAVGCTTSLRTVRGRVLKPSLDGKGYKGVSLSAEGRSKHAKVHALVCEAFHGPRPAGFQVAHNDGDPANCHYENLRWDTPKGNQADREAHGTRKNGQDHQSAKLTDDQVAVIRAARNATQQALANRFNVSRGHISNIVRGAYR